MQSKLFPLFFTSIIVMDFDSFANDLNYLRKYAQSSSYIFIQNKDIENSFKEIKLLYSIDCVGIVFITAMPKSLKFLINSYLSIFKKFREAPEKNYLYYKKKDPDNVFFKEYKNNAQLILEKLMVLKLICGVILFMVLFS